MLDASLTVCETSRVCGLSPRTVQLLVDERGLPAEQPSGRCGRWYVPGPAVFGLAVCAGLARRLPLTANWKLLPAVIRFIANQDVECLIADGKSFLVVSEGGCQILDAEGVLETLAAGEAAFLSVADMRQTLERFREAVGEIRRLQKRELFAAELVS